MCSISESLVIYVEYLPLPLGLASLAALSGMDADAEAGGVEDVDATAPCQTNENVKSC